ALGVAADNDAPLRREGVHEDPAVGDGDERESLRVAFRVAPIDAFCGLPAVLPTGQSGASATLYITASGITAGPRYAVGCGAQNARSASRSACDSAVTGRVGLRVARSKNGWGHVCPRNRQPSTMRIARARSLGFNPVEPCGGVPIANLPRIAPI